MVASPGIKGIDISLLYIQLGRCHLVPLFSAVQYLMAKCLMTGVGSYSFAAVSQHLNLPVYLTVLLVATPSL